MCSLFKLIPICGFAAITTAPAAVLYTTGQATDEIGADFTITTNSVLNNGTGSGRVPWSGFYGNSTTAKVAATITGTYKIGVFEGAGSGLNDYLYFQKSNGATDMDFFAYSASQSNFVPFAPASYTALTATWASSVTDVGTTGFRLTVLVGGQWYASNANAAPSFSTGFNYLTSSWVTVLDTVSGLSLGTTTSSYGDLFAGGATIDGVGFYVNQQTGITGNSTRRIDSFTIDGVPEPSSVLLSATGIGCLLVRRKGRR